MKGSGERSEGWGGGIMAVGRGACTWGKVWSGCAPLLGTDVGGERGRERGGGQRECVPEGGTRRGRQ